MLGTFVENRRHLLHRRHPIPRLGKRAIEGFGDHLVLRYDVHRVGENGSFLFAAVALHNARLSGVINRRREFP